MFEAALAHGLNQPTRAHLALRRAVDELELAGYAMYTAAARRRLGQLIGGAEGRMLVANGERFMSSQGARDLEAITELHCPGFA